MDYITLSTFWFFEQVDRLLEGVAIIEKAFVAKADEHRVGWENLLIELGGEESETIMDHTSFEHDKYAADLPQVTRQAVMVLQYALLEGHLDKVCQHIKHRMKLEIDPTDLRHKGVERSRTYLTKIADLDLDVGGKQWNRVRLLGKLRNILVHDLPTGMGPTSAEEYRKAVGALPDVRIEVADLFLEPGFLVAASEAYREVAGEVLRAARTRP